MSRIKDVAKEAGVSTSTVSHVINNTRFVSEDIKNKVNQAMDSLNYHPNLVARNLRRKSTNTIGLMVLNVANFFFADIISGIESVLKRENYNLILSNSDENFEYEKKQLKLFNANMIDGLIMSPTFYSYNYSKYLSDIKYPIVFIDCKNKDTYGDCVLSDNFGGAYQAVDYLIKKGHEKIGFIAGGMHLSTSIERLEGYRQAINDSNLEYNENYIKIGGDTRIFTGYNLAKELVENTDVTAIFVINNLMTVGALKFLKENNHKIPEDLGIIGFDDYPWATITEPSLTVVKQQNFQIGEKAARLILKKINMKESSDKTDYKEYRLPTELIIRDSC